MKNTILKSYTKKILKSEAFLSIIIVFVLAIGIIGTSYALYMDVDTDTDYQLVEVGDLAIGFDNGESTINLTNMVPMDDDIALKSTDNVFSFYIYNTGNYTANYDIKLEVLEDTNQVDTQYINYQFCKDNAQNCEDIKKLSDGNLIYTDELTPNSEDIYNKGAGSAYYFLRIWIDSEYKITEAKNISLKVTVYAKNASGLLDNKNTLVSKLLSDERVKINNTTPVFDGIADYVVTGDSTSGELGLFKAEDDYGISYYYRGAQSYNYVNFAGFTWRVVRINGDGSIRLILDGTLDKVCADYEKDSSGKCAKYAGTSTQFNSQSKDNAYVGYMYGLTGAKDYNCVKEKDGIKYIEENITKESACIDGEWLSGYDTTHMNLYSSTIKTNIDTFYETYIDNDTTRQYGEFLADTMFCGDKSLAKDDIGNITKQLGYGTNASYYAATERLVYEEKYTAIKIASPTLKCASRETNPYSRYTVEKQNINNVSTNGDLTYPIALLSADELMLAGGFRDKTNKNFYLWSNSWWLLTPCYSISGTWVFSSIISYSLYYGYTVLYEEGVRPVINLKADVLYKTGDGTKGTPYEIKYN